MEINALSLTKELDNIRLDLSNKMDALRLKYYGNKEDVDFIKVPGCSTTSFLKNHSLLEIALFSLTVAISVAIVVVSILGAYWVCNP